MATEGWEDGPTTETDEELYLRRGAGEILQQEQDQEILPKGNENTAGSTGNAGGPRGSAFQDGEIEQWLMDTSPNARMRAMEGSDSRQPPGF